MEIKKLIQNTTSSPGVYIMKNSANDIIYIGKAKNLRKRLLSYLQVSYDLKGRRLANELKDLEIIVTPTELDAILLESNLIKKHKPIYNVQLKEGRKHAYICCTSQHKYPRIFFARGKQAQSNNKYFGPYLRSQDIYDVLNFIYKSFKIRQCNNNYFKNRSRPCLQYQISRCSAPCVKYISEAAYKKQVQLATMFLKGQSNKILSALTKEMKAESLKQHYEKAAKIRDLIVRIKAIQQKQIIESEGDRDIIALINKCEQICIQILKMRNGSMISSDSYFLNNALNRKEEDILTEFIAQYYLRNENKTDLPQEIITNILLSEKQILQDFLYTLATQKIIITYPQRGQKFDSLKMAINSANEANAKRLIKNNFYKESFAELQKFLKLKNPINRIECFDISHFSGDATVGSCVVCKNSGLDKNAYRKYSIEMETIDDYKALTIIIKQRLKKLLANKKELPDVILIDGGVGQVSAIIKLLVTLKLGIKRPNIIGIAKGKSRKPGLEKIYIENKLSPLDMNSKNFQLLQIVRDEAHRFAINYQRKKLRNSQLSSLLESITGIGNAKRRLILEHFDGLTRMKKASMEEFAQISGIGLKLAQDIYTFLHS